METWYILLPKVMLYSFPLYTLLSMPLIQSNIIIFILLFIYIISSNLDELANNNNSTIVIEVLYLLLTNDRWR